MDVLAEKTMTTTQGLWHNTESRAFELTSAVSDLVGAKAATASTSFVATLESTSQVLESMNKGGHIASEKASEVGHSAKVRSASAMLLGKVDQAFNNLVSLCIGVVLSR